MHSLIKPFLVSGLLMPPCPRKVTWSGPNSTWEGPTPGYRWRGARYFGGHYNNDLAQYRPLDNILLGNYACSWDFPGGPVVGTLSFHCRKSWVQSLVGELTSCIRLRKEKRERKTVHVLLFFYAKFYLFFSTYFYVLKKKYHLIHMIFNTHRYVYMFICLYTCWSKSERQFKKLLIVVNFQE